MTDSQLEAHLIVSLASAAVDNSVGPFLFRNFHQTLGNQRAGKGGSQQIPVLVHGTGLHGGNDVVVHKFLGQVLHIQLGRAGGLGLFLQPLQFIRLTHIAGHGNNFAVVIVFFQPGDQDRSIQTAGIRQNDFFNLFHRRNASVCNQNFFSRSSIRYAYYTPFE